MLRRFKGYTRIISFISMLMFYVMPVLATPPHIGEVAELDFPTLRALQETTVPSVDRYALAREFLGVDVALPTTRTAPPYTMGAIERFTVNNSLSNRMLGIDAELMGIGKHAYVWVEVGNRPVVGTAQNLAVRFDEEVYKQTRELWGSEPSPGVDGDARVHLLFTTEVSPGVLAYFASRHSYPRAIVPTSNERDMLIFNLNTLGLDLTHEEVVSAAAHEFQHMIRHNQDTNEVTWADEAFSTFTEEYLGFEVNGWASQSFLRAPQTSLNDWPMTGETAPHYGASMMFMMYFYDRFGLDAVKAVSAHPDDGLVAFDKVLRESYNTTVDALFADWVLANGMQQRNSLYGYSHRWREFQRSATRATVTDYPFGQSERLAQYGTHYYLLERVRNREMLVVSLDVPDDISLVRPYLLGDEDNRWAMYGNRGDDIHTRLWRAFDLRNVDSATLTYRLWHDLETYWDYAYVTISTDGGATWHMLESARTTTENPNGRSYGEGYTDSSGGWVMESVSLDDYAGQTVRIAFEMITDDSINEPGILIDDIAIDAIGYRTDFEDDDGGWQSTGWIRTDNRLPQYVWVQAVQYRSDHDPHITRWLAQPDTLDTTRWQLDLHADVEYVLLAVSPFAPLTTTSMPYSLRIEAR